MKRSNLSLVLVPVDRGLHRVLGALLLAYVPAALSAGYIGDANGCKAFDPSPVMNESITWTGACKDGYLDGVGTLSWTVNGQPDGSTSGNFTKGKIDGQGVRLFKSGNRYEGSFQDDQPSGEGKMTYPNGAVYVGSFVAGRRQGHGVVTFPTGQRYEGEFKVGFVGQGTLTYPNGAHVTGRFEGPPFDDAVLTEADGTVFKGAFLGRTVAQSDEKRWQDAFTQQLNAALSSDSHTASRGLVAGLLRVTFNADGSPASFALEGATGSPELDNQVLALAHDTKNLPPFPQPERGAVVIFSDSVKGSPTPGPGAGQTATTYGLKFNGSTGTNIARNQVEGLPVPPDKSYEELSPEEKRSVRSRYANMPAGDEPPYPLDGPAKLYRGATELARRYQVEGELSLVVDINEKGTATGVSVLSNPGQDFVKDVATLLMVQKYKPGICAGQPCRMQYPFGINYLGRTGAH